MIKLLTILVLGITLAFVRSSTPPTPDVTADKTAQIHIPVLTPVRAVDAREAFERLSHQEKLYAYYMSKASWEGIKICFI